jgi:hypothetical protein
MTVGGVALLATHLPHESSNPVIQHSTSGCTDRLRSFERVIVFTGVQLWSARHECGRSCSVLTALCSSWCALSCSTLSYRRIRGVRGIMSKHVPAVSLNGHRPESRYCPWQSASRPRWAGNGHVVQQSIKASSASAFGLARNASHASHLTCHLSRDKCPSLILPQRLWLQMPPTKRPCPPLRHRLPRNCFCFFAPLQLIMQPFSLPFAA